MRREAIYCTSGRSRRMIEDCVLNSYPCAIMGLLVYYEMKRVHGASLGVREFENRARLHHCSIRGSPTVQGNNYNRSHRGRASGGSIGLASPAKETSRPIWRRRASLQLILASDAKRRWRYRPRCSVRSAHLIKLSIIAQEQLLQPLADHHQTRPRRPPSLTLIAR